MNRMLGRVLLVVALLFGTPRLLLSQDNVMFAHFINVGQASSTLLEFSCGAILIDAGASDDDHIANLTDSLHTFFQVRRDLSNTLESIIITHNHIDHTRALRCVVEQFNVKRYIDNGQLTGPGTANPNWVRQNAQTGGRNITLRGVLNSEITDLPERNGLTDSTIDSVDCAGTNPKIAALSGRRDDNPGGSHEDFDNKNNHSIVIRVDFGKASFSFTGDLEKPAIEALLDWYKETTTLDTDVYEVGHHESHNGTTTELLDAVTPEIAVISVGKSTDGQGLSNRFNTFHYGHPRKLTVDMLSLSIQGRRSAPINVEVADAQNTFCLTWHESACTPPVGTVQ